MHASFCSVHGFFLESPTKSKKQIFCLPASSLWSLPLRPTAFPLPPSTPPPNQQPNPHRRAPCFAVPYIPQRMEKRTLRTNGPAYATRETQLTPPPAAFMAMDDTPSSALASALQNDENNNFRQFFSAPGYLPPPTTMSATAVAAAAAAAAAATTATASSPATASPSGPAGTGLGPRASQAGEGEGSALAADFAHNDNIEGVREGEAGLAARNGPKFASASQSLSASWSSSWASSISGRLGRVGARLISPGVSKRALQVRACPCLPVCACLCVRPSPVE